MKVIGIDPGSKSFDIFGLDVETNKICIDTSITTKRVFQSPQILIDMIKSQEPFDYLAAPSGFGFPIKRVQDLTPQNMFEITLKKHNTNTILGLQAVLEELKKTSWNCNVIPGVKNLQSVPDYRKINKIDLGTADKLCAVVVGIKDIMERFSCECTEVNFILVELGSSFSAILGIEKGKIIDGIGGSNILGFKACGALDGELAYLMEDITKKKIYHGGISSIVGYEDLDPEEILLLANRDKKSKMALEGFLDSIVKGVYSIYASFENKKQIQMILLSGRLSNISYFEEQLQQRLIDIAPIDQMKSFGFIAKRAAQGAAFIAEGLNGGPSEKIIQNLGIESANGHILDHIYLELDPIIKKIMSD